MVLDFVYDHTMTFLNRMSYGFVEMQQLSDFQWKRTIRHTSDPMNDTQPKIFRSNSKRYSFKSPFKSIFNTDERKMKNTAFSICIPVSYIFLSFFILIVCNGIRIFHLIHRRALKCYKIGKKKH